MKVNIGWQLMTSLLSLPGILLFFGGAEQAIAHGVKLTHQTTSAVEIKAAYDSGSPMVNAQVNVYTPDDPVNPWKVGVTDAQGVFIFAPDVEKTGYWEVQVRQAGHGGVVSVPVQVNSRTQFTTPLPGESSSQSSTTGGYSPLQKGVMIGSVIWGLVGTALFFNRLQHTPQQVSSRSELER
ncbi:MAG: carboxypeptidase regulatory-like domain-containing protein [Microcoleaceae cyanobacterium]